MYQSKVIRLLSFLSKPELKRFHLFLKSPFYNTNPTIIQLYRFLRTAYPEFASPKLAKHRVFKKIYPGKAYNHQLLLNLMSDFTLLLKKYLQVIELEKQEFLQQKLLLLSYKDRSRGYDFFIKGLKKANEFLDCSTDRGAPFYRQKFELSQLYLRHPNIDKFRLMKSEYEASMEQLDQWFQLEKIRLSCEVKAREAALAEEYDIWMLEEVRKELAQVSTDRPMSNAYLAMFKLLEKGEEPAFYQLKTLLFQQNASFTKQQQQNMLECLINYSIRIGNRGEGKFVVENFELYQFGLEADLLFEQGFINDLVYINIVNIAIRSGQLDWCIEFIEKYEVYLVPRTSKDAVILGKSLWLYANQKSEEALALLTQFEFLNVYYQTQSRVLIIKIYFESLQKDRAFFQVIESQLEAFEKYLRRNIKIAKRKKKALLNFVLAAKLLLKAKQNRSLDQQMKSKLRAQFLATDLLYGQSWLLEQIE